MTFLSLFIAAQSSFAFERRGKEKWAILFIDPQLNKQPRARAGMKVVYAEDLLWYKHKGYKTFTLFYTDRALIDAILNQNVKAVAYYGHGNTNNSTFGGLRNASSWRRRIKAELIRRLKKRGVNPEKAKRRSAVLVKNFGFKDVVNRSCGSLLDKDIANLFVAPGENYYGCRAQTYILSLFACVMDDADCSMTKYTIPEKKPQRRPGTYRPNAAPNSCSGRQCCRGHHLYCKEAYASQVYDYPHTALDRDENGICDICGKRYLRNNHKLAPGLRYALRGDYICKPKPW